MLWMGDIGGWMGDIGGWMGASLALGSILCSLVIYSSFSVRGGW